MKKFGWTPGQIRRDVTPRDLFLLNEATRYDGIPDDEQPG